MYDTSTKAWRVTEANTGVLSTISGVNEATFTANIGWVLVEDWDEHPRFILTPERIFNDIYPRVELISLMVDEETPADIQVVEEYPTSIADFDPSNIDYTRRVIPASL